MATITLEYDARNSLSKKALDFLLAMNLFSVKSTDEKEKKEETELKRSVVRSLKQAEEISSKIRRNKSTKGLKTLDEIL